MKWAGRIFFLFALMATTFFFSKDGQQKNIFHADSLGYYSYLPSYFCLNNFDSISRLPQDGSIPGSVIEYFNTFTSLRQKSETGYYINPYTYGVAFFELPFFAVAQGYSKFNNLNSTGYSSLHHSMLMLSNLFYVFLGLLFTYRILRKLFDSDTALLTVSLVLLASNLFWFTAIQFGMAHPILFFLVAFLIYNTMLFFERPSILKGSFIFLSLGFIAIIRPTDVLFGLIPLLYHIGSWQDVKDRWLFIKTHRGKLLMTLPLFFVPLIPQLLYWKKYTGSFIFYTHAEESFNFFDPKLLEGIFGPDNGWLLYSPIWILALVILFTKKNLHGFKSVILVLLPIYLYVIYSWHCYQYINGFGSRPMLHMYPLLAIPLAVFIQTIFLRIRWAIIPLLVVLSFFTYHNLHFSYITQAGKYWSEFSNYEFYWNMTFKSNLNYNDIVVKDTRLLQPRESSLIKLADLNAFSSEDDTLYTHVYDPHLRDSVLVIPEGEESPKIGLSADLNSFINKKNCFVKASCAVQFSRYNSDPYQSVVLAHKFGRDGKEISWVGLNLYTKAGLPNKRDLAVDSIWLYGGTPHIWDTLSYYIPVANNTENLISKVDFWNMAKMKFYLHSVKLELYQEK